MNDASVSPPRREVESRDPATGEVWRRFATADGPAVTSAHLKARSAQPAWAATPVSGRMELLARFHEVLYRRRAEVAALVTRESGKPYVDALGVDVTVTLDFTKWHLRAVPRFLRTGWRGAYGVTMWRKRVRTQRKPVGVIGVITPWNYPFFLPAACALPAIACGNAVILKPSEFTPSCGEILGDLWREAGLPDGVLQVVQGDGVTGAALTRSGVDKMIFTGSAAAGRQVALGCAERMIPCSLELGGSDAAVVLADADVQHAADGIVWTRFANAGQTCVAPKRVYVEAPAYDAFVAAAARAVNALRVGPGADATTEVGPMIRPQATRAIRAQFDDAVRLGATIAAQADSPEGDAYFPPTLLTDVRDEMRVMREETFGPLLPVVKVADADEAVRRANATAFGLSASVWTRDRARGRAVAEQLEAGTVLINDAIAVVGMPDVSYGGVKTSGLGRLHGEAGLEASVQTIPIVDDRFATWHQPWWFRYGEAHLSHLEDYQRFAHGHGLVERLRGLAGTIALVFSRRGN